MRRAQRCRFGGQQGWQNLATAGDSTKTAFRSGSDSEDRKKSNRLEPSPGRYPIPQAEQLFKPQNRNVGGRGGSPSSFPWVSKGDILFEKRMSPLFALPCGLAGENSAALRAADSPYLRKSRRQNDTTSCAGFDVVVMRSTYSTGPSPS